MEMTVKELVVWEDMIILRLKQNGFKDFMVLLELDSELNQTYEFGQNVKVRSAWFSQALIRFLLNVKRETEKCFEPLRR